jgi:pimeloyl-ACP methyl ester carboxylesterase
MTVQRYALMAAGMALFALACVTGSARAMPVQPSHGIPPSVVRVQASNQAQIYLLRGLANVFSRGMDQMGERLTGYGFAPVVMNHRGWQNAADTIARNYKAGRRAPVIIIGHSLGGNAAFQMAQRLQGQNVPVAYLVTFDPTRTFTVPANVRYFSNFYQNNRQGRPAIIPAQRGDQKSNVNLTNSPGLTHTNIDQSPRLQTIVIGRILYHAPR